MPELPTITYNIADIIELNLSFMPFLKNGGLFVPTAESHPLGEKVIIDLQLATKKENLRIEGTVVWITPKNALYHVSSGIGIQFTGEHAASVRTQIESMLDKTVDVGGYSYGITERTK